MPFCLCPLAVFGFFFNALANCLSPHGTNISTLVIINDGWDLEISANMFLGRVARKLMSGCNRLSFNFGNILPSYSFDFGNFAWVENATQDVRYC